MVARDVEEKLRKLASVDSDAHLKWLFYISGNSLERQEADDLLGVLLFQHIKKDFRERIFLDPSPPSEC